MASSGRSADEVVTLGGDLMAQGADVVEFEVSAHRRGPTLLELLPRFISATPNLPVSVRIERPDQAPVALGAGAAMLSGAGVDDDEVLRQCVDAGVSVTLPAGHSADSLTRALERWAAVGLDRERMILELVPEWSLAVPPVAASAGVPLATWIGEGGDPAEAMGAGSAAVVSGVRVLRTDAPRSLRRVAHVISAVGALR